MVGLIKTASSAQATDPTKHDIVGLVGKFYKDLGILFPVMVQFKMFLQELCKAQVDWDQPLTDSLIGRWNPLKSSLENAQPISVPRCYFDRISEEVIFCIPCGFCDVSLKAYTGVVHLLIETTAGFCVQFVAAKTRVAPIREQTIRRLKLLSVLLLGQLLTSVMQSLHDELQLVLRHCFTDSTVSVCCIKRTDKTWKPFV